jgi:hypothetical protein
MDLDAAGCPLIIEFQAHLAEARLDVDVAARLHAIGPHRPELMGSDGKGHGGPVPEIFAAVHEQDGAGGGNLGLGDAEVAELIDERQILCY